MKRNEATPNVAGSLAAELDRLKEEAKRAYDSYKNEPDPLIAGASLDNWLAISKSIASLAKIAPRADAEAGAVLNAADVEKGYTRSLLTFRHALENLGRRISNNPLFSKLNPVDVELIVAAETNATLTQLAQDLSVPPPAKFPDLNARASSGVGKYAEWHELHDKLSKAALKEGRDWFNKKELIALEKLTAKVESRKPRDRFGDEDLMPGPGWQGWLDYDKRIAK